MQQARREEMRYFREMGVYDKVPVAECWQEAGHARTGNETYGLEDSGNQIPYES